MLIFWKPTLQEEKKIIIRHLNEKCKFGTPTNENKSTKAEAQVEG